jgi:signal transduction histidine kinase
MELHKRSPHRDAMFIAGSYAAIGGIYIISSGKIALRMTSDPNTLASIEEIKGLAFVVVTAVALFVFTRGLLSRYVRIEQQNRAARAELSLAQHRIEQYLVMASVCHDSNNVLVALRLALDMLKQDVDDGRQSPGMFDELTLQCQRLEDMNKRLMESGRGPLTIALKPLRLDEQFRKFIQSVRYSPDLSNVSITAQGLDGIQVQGDPVVLHQVMLNLVLNAAQTGNGSHRRILVRTVPDGKFVNVEIHDDGPGIPEEQIQQIFQPYTSTKVAGMGLGLLSVRAGARTLNGSVRAMASDVLGGACFQLRLRADEPATV